MIELDRQGGNGEQLLELRSELENAVVLDMVERANSERIAHQCEALLRSTPPGAGKRAIETGRAGPEPVRQLRGGRGHRRRKDAATGDGVAIGAMNALRLGGA